MDQPVSEFICVIHRVRDLDRAKAWYREKLGLTTFYETRDDPVNVYASLRIGSTVLALWQLGPDEREIRTGSLAGTYVALGTWDIEASRRLLEERGVECRRIMERDGYRWFWLFDPDGNRIEIDQLPVPG